MNRIIEVDEEEMYVVIEPVVTFGQLKTFLENRYPTLEYAYPLAPPYTSVMANALLDGLNNLSYKHGAMSEWIQGMEVVLPDGIVVNIGANSVSKKNENSRFWFGRAPLPDISGLFISWEGTTGIVTKIALSLWPKPRFKKRYLVMTYNYNTAYSLMRSISRTMVCDELAGFSWVAGKMMFLKGGDMKRSDDDPEFLLFIEFSGNTEKELNSKEEIIFDIIKREKDVEEPLDVDVIAKTYPEYSKLAILPTTLDFMLDYGGGGLTWVGSYGPSSTWVKGAIQGSRISEKYGFPPLLVARPMKGGHYQVLRFIITFKKNDTEQKNRVKDCVRELAGFLLDIGYIPYKAPVWAAQMICERMDKNFFELMKRIKYILDPNGIMNPEKWNLHLRQ